MLTNPSGNVGINTTVPNATLHVIGNVKIQAGFVLNSSGVILNISNSTGQTNCVFTANGNMYCSGTKSALQDTESHGERLLYAVESPDVRYVDEGRAKLRKGFANISLDPIFRETIEDSYNVYLTPEGKTKALYVAEKAKDYFIVKDTASTNAVFSYIISAYRKGYASKRFDSGSDIEIEITATIDDSTDTTEIELSGNLASESKNAGPSASQSQNQAQSTQQTQQNTTKENTSSAISVSQATSNISQPESQQTQQNLSAGSNAITANLINEAGLETDLTNILEPAAEPSSNVITSSPDAEIENNLNEDKKITITDTTYKYIGQTAAHSFTINSIDEEEIIEKIQEKTKLDKDKIKRAIKFKKKEPIKDSVEENLPEEKSPSIAELGYITKVNGSVIIRLG